jgi:DNA-binding transcriptional MerR regulator
MDDTPRYRIRTVSELTQISEPTLRAWERRYGIPQPSRSDNRYRLYSDRDIQLIRYMHALTLAGHSPAQASQLSMEILDTPKEIQNPKITYPSLEQLSSELIEACIGFHGTKVEKILQTGMTMGSAWIVYQKMIEPALIKIGELWENGTIGIEREQILSQAVRNTLMQILNLMRPPQAKKRVLLACIDEELHDIPLYGLAIYAAHRGWSPIVLGARLPALALSNAVKGLEINCIALSSTTNLQTSHQAFDAHTFFKAYQDACGMIPWMIGGSQARKWASEIEPLQGKVAYSIEDFGHFLDEIELKIKG